MKAIVRDDIISLKSFVAAEFKYKRYLEILKKAGNYCFLDQFKKIVPGGLTIINGMAENNLISTENINKNYKYVYLTDTAMKYLCLKDSEEDFSDVQKNKISVIKVNKYPTEKQLFSSAYKFHLLANDELMVDKESILNALGDSIYLQELGFTKENFHKSTTERMKSINDKKSKMKSINSNLKDLESVFKDINKDIFDNHAESKEMRELKGEKFSIENEIKKRKNERKLIKSSTTELEAQLSKIELSINELSKILELKDNTIGKYNVLLKERSARNMKNDTILQNAEDEVTERLQKEQDIVIPKVEKSKRTFEKLYDISKVIARIKDNTLEFIIFDYGNFKTAAQYFKLIINIQDLELNHDDLKIYDNLKIIIYSYAEHRAENLTKEFLSYDKRRANALKSLRAYNARREEFGDHEDGGRPTFFIQADKTVDSIPKFELEVRTDFYYMSTYKEYVARGIQSIKRKDRIVIDDLIEKLKK